MPRLGRDSPSDFTSLHLIVESSGEASLRFIADLIRTAGGASRRSIVGGGSGSHLPPPASSSRPDRYQMRKPCEPRSYGTAIGLPSSSFKCALPFFGEVVVLRQ